MMDTDSRIPPPDYDLVGAWQANIRQVQKAWNSDWVKDKIARHLQRTEGHQDPDRVLAIAHKIQHDPDLASHYCKNPGRQSSHQTIFAQWLARLPEGLVSHPQALPSRGPHSLHVFGGKIFAFETSSDRPEGANGKSIDFVWKTHGLEIYATHKFTGDEGGAQDNQYHDVQRFLLEARPNTQPHQRFVAICDGPYYLRPAAEHRALSRIAYLRAGCSANSTALQSTDLVAWLESLARP